VQSDVPAPEIDTPGGIDHVARQRSSADEPLAEPVRKRRRRRWLPSWKLLLGLLILAIASVIIAVSVVYATVRIPPTDEQSTAQAAIIEYSNGQVMARLGANRENVELAQVPRPVRDAVMAAEDRTFYTNQGVDAKSIVRAALSNAKGGSQGGSTISQQYVKNVYNERERTFKRKFTEIFLAVKINRQKSKDEILERYLNTIYWGRGAFGIQAAAQAYFHKDVGQLTVSQGAFLAGIINAPALADPRTGKAHRDRAERRWRVVLDAMVKEGWLDQATRQELVFPATVKPARDGVLHGQTGYLVTLVESELKRKLGMTDEQFRTGGYQIRTTFDQNMMSAGLDAIAHELPKRKPKKLQIGMTAIDPRTGAVRALYGGADFLKRQQNSATQDRVESAGTFSTFALVAAFRSGIGFGNSLDGSTPLKIDGQVVRNYRAKQYGQIGVFDAARESVNTALADLNSQVGPQQTRSAAYAAGIPKSVKIGAGVSNVLGEVGLAPMDLAGAYATLASGGIQRKPYVVQSVSRIDGDHEVFRMGSAQTKGKRTLPAGAVSTTTFALQQAVYSGTGSYATLLKRPAAGQTGTSASARSAWFVGYTPELATAVSMYQLTRNGKNIARMKGFGRYSSITGGGYPTQIWTSFMAKALAGKPVSNFPRPDFAELKKGISAKRIVVPAPQPVK
jgi:membrane peptidoglycan carboxypeptidase